MARTDADGEKNPCMLIVGKLREGSEGYLKPVGSLTSTFLNDELKKVPTVRGRLQCLSQLASNRPSDELEGRWVWRARRVASSPLSRLSRWAFPAPHVYLPWPSLKLGSRAHSSDLEPTSGWVRKHGQRIGRLREAWCECVLGV